MEQNQARVISANTPYNFKDYTISYLTEESKLFWPEDFRASTTNKGNDTSPTLQPKEASNPRKLSGEGLQQKIAGILKQSNATVKAEDDDDGDDRSTLTRDRQTSSYVFLTKPVEKLNNGVSPY